MTCGCRHPRDTRERPEKGTGQGTPRWWIDLASGGSVARIELRRLVAVRVGGMDVVPLGEVAAASHLGIHVESCTFDFVGDDGFQVTSKERQPIDGSQLATGYICVATRDLIWQPRPERPCSWRVKAVARMMAMPKELVREDAQAGVVA
jgi:hypothetical protein